MSTDFRIREREQDQAERAVVPSPATRPLEAVISQIAHDSRQDADIYLEETKVPHGGE